MAELWVSPSIGTANFRKVTLEALASAAQAVAGELGGRCHRGALGQGPGRQVRRIGQIGASQSALRRDDINDYYSSDAYANALAALAKEQGPVAIILPASVQGKDLAGRLAAKLDVGAAVDCIALAVEDGRLKATRPMYAGKV
jgi:electron transfer flavoprotein alpha subunit